MDPLKLALEMIRRKDRLTAEVCAALERAGFDETVTEQTLATLAARKLLDDARVARHFAERRREAGYGEARIRAELIARGLSESDAARMMGHEDELPRALAALRGKFKQGADPAPMGRFLASRGFEEESIELAIEAF